MGSEDPHDFGHRLGKVASQTEDALCENDVTARVGDRDRLTIAFDRLGSPWVMVVGGERLAQGYDVPTPEQVIDGVAAAADR